MDRPFHQSSAVPINAWINKKLRKVVSAVSNAIEGYRFNDAATALYQFVWHEYCDWYLEMVKVHGSVSPDSHTLENMLFVHDVMTRLLHPFIPFVTEEVYHILGSNGSILQAPYPAVDQLLDQDGAADDAAGEIDVIIDVVKRIRNIRAECNVPAASEVDIGFSGTGERLGLIQKYPHYITRLTRGKSMDVHR
ncbi:MAG: class I tRNA ligase family protein, partial [Deltaproteobacteria bacterium]|nr:class I tRNA ligase family protein [Deltaproteobacteria bacterium]